MRDSRPSNARPEARRRSWEELVEYSGVERKRDPSPRARQPLSRRAVSRAWFGDDGGWLGLNLKWQWAEILEGKCQDSPGGAELAEAWHVTRPSLVTIGLTLQLHSGLSIGL